MAGDELVGNMDSLLMVDYFKKKNALTVLNEAALNKSTAMASEIFLNH
jgi:hydroxymethylglutaryl-CoA lyase